MECILFSCFRVVIDDLHSYAWYYYLFITAIIITFNVIPKVQPIEPNHTVPNSGKDHMLRFRCNVNFPVANKEHVFDLKWYLNGKTIFQKNTDTTNMKEEEFRQKAILTANDLKYANQMTMGFKVIQKEMIKRQEMY